MFIDISLCLTGFILLALSSSALITGSSSVALRYGIPKHLIGMTIVALGTSLPEIMVSAFASFEPTNSLSVGNIIGSNIANMGLILGLACIFRPIKIDPEIIKTEYIFLIGITVGVGTLFLNYQLGVFDGIILLIMLASFLYWMATTTNHYAKKQLKQVTEGQLFQHKEPLLKSILFIIFAVIVMPVATYLTVKGAEAVAQDLGLTILYAGLFFTAIGTSLPELSTTIASLIKNEKGIMLGNLIGSNIFNLLAALPFPAFFAASKLSEQIVYRDIAFMIFITILPFIRFSHRIEDSTFSKQRGYLLLGCYFFYLIFTTISERF